LSRRLICLALLSLALPLAADGDRVATAYEVRPVVQAQLSPQGPQPLKAGQPLYAGTQLKAQPSGRAKLLLVDETIVAVEGGSDLTVGMDTEGSLLLKLMAGLGRLVSSPAKQRKIVLETNTAVVAIKGTQYQVRANAEHSEVQVLEGAVELKPLSGTAAVLVSAGEAALSYPDRVDAVRKLTFKEVQGLKKAFKDLVRKSQLDYAERVRQAKGKRSTKTEGKP
jgi:hypothetical protein